MQLRNEILMKAIRFISLCRRLSDGLADIKVLASKLCLSRAPFDHKNRGAGLALQLCLHLRRRPNAVDLPQPIVNEFLLLSASREASSPHAQGTKWCGQSTMLRNRSRSGPASRACSSGQSNPVRRISPVARSSWFFQKN